MRLSTGWASAITSSTPTMLSQAGIDAEGIVDRTLAALDVGTARPRRAVTS